MQVSVLFDSLCSFVGRKSKRYGFQAVEHVYISVCARACLYNYKKTMALAKRSMIYQPLKDQLGR